MTQVHKVSTVVGLCFAGLLVAGCGGGLVPVHGKITLPSGQPAAGCQLVVEGEPAGKKIAARGDVRDDGSYELSMLKPGDGVPPGKYRVQVNPPPMVNADAPATVPFNAKYTNFATSGLEFEVKPGQKNEFTVQLNK